MAGGRPANVNRVRSEFIEELDRAAALVDAIKVIPSQVRRSNKPGLHPKHKRQVIELAFMGMVASWEEFVEQALVRYLSGAETKKGRKPRLKAGRADSIQHAYELLSLDPNYNPEKSYLKISDPNWICRVCDFYFSSHRFGCLREKSDLIKHANAIRNRVAHNSRKCKAEFKSTALHFLNHPDGKLKQGYGPAALLQEVVQRHFGQKAIDRNKTHFEAYAALFRGLSKRIVPK